MTCFSDVTLGKMRKVGKKAEILVLFEHTCFINGFILVEPIQQSYNDSSNTNVEYVLF